MKKITFISIPFVLCLALSSCASSEGADSGLRRVQVSPNAYEIEQTKRYEFEKQDERLTWR